MTIGVLVGGRLGYVLFYEPGYYLQNPLEIPAVWKGGMAFHGGLDRLDHRHRAVRAPQRRRRLERAGLVRGGHADRPVLRAACQFHQCRAVGPSDTMWPGRLVFPGAGPVPRHPSQLYEAVLEGLVLFAVLWWLTHARLALQQAGLVAGVFLAGYGLARSFCELFREPDFGTSYGPLHAPASSIPCR